MKKISKILTIKIQIISGGKLSLKVQPNFSIKSFIKINVNTFNIIFFIL